MKKALNILAVQIFVFVLWLGSGLASEAIAQEQPTIQSINTINGFHDALVAIEDAFQNDFDEYPGPKPEKLMDAWEIAVEGAFDADKMTAAVNAQIDGRLTDPELSELYQYFSSPLGMKVSALEIANTKLSHTPERAAEGERVFAGLATDDPERLALYNRMIDGLAAVDFAEAVTLNVAYGMMAGLFGAAETPVTDEELLSLVKAATAGLRQTVEKTLRAETALGYRELSNAELKRYVEFLETPASAHYYDTSLHALDTVMSKEARDFGDRLFKAMGMRKA